MASPLKVIGNIGKRIGHAVGELSSWSTLYGGTLTNTYSLDSKRVDIELARQLYYNENDDYKLGAGFAKPIVNAVVGFMGVPEFVLEDEGAEEVLAEFREENVSRMQRTHRNAIRDGKCYVRLTRRMLEDTEDQILYPERKAIIKYNIIPPENVEEVVRDPITDEAVKYVIKTSHEAPSGHGSINITQTITAQTIDVECDGEAPEDLEVGERENIWGFIPILEFTNEREAHSRTPRSDLEGVEPYIKAYHDVFKHAIQGSKLHSTPRLKLTVQDVAGFLRNNFGIEDPKAHIDSGEAINLENKDLLIFTDENEDAEFIEVESAIGSAEPLLKFLFYSIIEHSETPEFLFGAHLPANYASVKEQMPVLVRRVGRKREYFSEAWKMLARYVLAMHSMANSAKFTSHKATLEWDKIDPRDASDVAKELKDVTSALEKAINMDLISRESASTYLATTIKLMQEYDKERKLMEDYRKSLEDLDDNSDNNPDGNPDNNPDGNPDDNNPDEE